MAWIYGIPNFIGLYTYYDDLLEPTYNPNLAGLKRGLWQRATTNARSYAASLTSLQNIEDANTFLKLVAENERTKEIKMIQAFYNKTREIFPTLLQEYLNSPEKIQDDPSGFYTVFTAEINKARKGTEDYLRELKRIKKNIDDGTRTLQNYKADDYRYRLSGDITSFLHRLTGSFTVKLEKDVEKDGNQEFAIRVQSLAIRILEKLGIRDKLSSGENFAAIAASLLIQIESEIQKEVDKDLLSKTRENIDKGIDTILEQIEERYDKLANKQRIATSPIDKALTDIGGLEFNRIVNNAKDILNIHSDLSQDEKQLHKKIQSRESRIMKNSGVKRNQEIKKMRDSIKQNSNLNRNLEFVKFSISGSQNSKHGNINELVVSILGNGTKVSGNAATDIMTFMFNGDAQIDNAILNKLMQDIGNTYTEAIAQQTPSKDDKEIKDTRQIMIEMNNKINELIKEAENKIALQKDFKLDNIFIFHESLKLYSSAETGRNKEGGGFGGRNISIMSYIDDLYSMSNSFSFPVSRDELGFLAINLMPGAAAAEQKDPLERYLSLYAGMVMFDDLTNMAQGAIASLVPYNQSNTITQIHLYNLNGVYVPASMVLSYISDAVNNTSALINSGYAAKATIKVPSNNQTYSNYLSARDTAETWVLTPEIWKEVAAENNLNTKVSITFLSAFTTFIEKLNSLT